MRATCLFGIGLSAAMVAAAAGQVPFTPGNLVVSQIHDGTGTVAAGSAAPMLLVELNISTGAVVQTIPMPTVPSGSNRALTIRGSSTSVAHLNRSLDNRYLTLMGFDAPVGTATISMTPAATFNRVVALIDANGAIDTTTALNDAYDSTGSSNADPRQCVTTNGTDLWTSGVGFPVLSAGARYTTRGATTSTQLASSPTNTRCMRAFGGQLYLTTMSGSFQGVNSVGTGLPTASGQAILQLVGFPAVSGPSFYDFFFADANTIYVANDLTLAAIPATNAGGIMKWTYDAGTLTWTHAYTMNTGLTNGCRGLIGRVNRAGVQLWATTADAIPQVVTVVDTGATSAFTTLATSPTSTGTQALYRGIDFVPEGAAPVACYPNCDQSTTVPCLNVLDFSCFLNKFAANDTYANCDQSTTAPVLNVLDFSCFLNKFAAGCSAC